LHFEPCLVDSGSVTAEARHIGTPAPEVTVAVEGRKGSLAGQWFERPIVHLEVDTSRVQIRNARFARGDTSFVADLDVKGKGERATIDVRRITVTTTTDVWVTKVPSQMHVEPGVLYVDSLVVACPRGELGGEGVIRQKAKTLDFDAWGKGIDLSVVRDVTKLPFRLTGQGNFKLGLSGAMSDPRGRIEITIDNGVVDSVAFDNLTARAGFDGKSYQVEHLQVVAGKDTATANGTWNSRVSPARIAKGERGSSVWDAPLQGRLRFAHYPLATVFKAGHRPTLVAAAFHGSVELGGTLDSPTAHIRGSIVPAPGPGREIPPADVDVSYADGFLRVAKFNTTEELNVRISGSFPLTLSVHDGARIEENEPLQFKLDIAPHENAAVEIGRYVKGVSLLRGIISGNVQGSGTPAAPRLSGGLSMTHGELRVVGLEEEFRDIAVRVDFIDDVVRLTSLSTRSGEKGSLIATGWARMSNYQPADYKLDLSMREFWLRSIEDVEVRTDGNMSVRLRPWRDGRLIPNITGKLNVREANITMDIMKSAEETGAKAAEFTRPTDRPNWLASVDLTADKNVWIRNPDLIAELEGDVILNRDERGLYFRGDMTVLRGSYKVFGNKFEVTDGTFDFSASETLRPSMQISAYTPHYDPSKDESGNINLTLTWPYDQKEPRIRLSYDVPGYSEADIWAMLGGIGGFGTLGAGVATNTLERAINAQMTGGINVTVGQRNVDYSDPHNPNKTGGQVTTFGFNKYLWQDIYLEYQRDLSTQSQQEVNVEYRLGRRFQIRSQMIYNSRRNTGAKKGQSTDEYNLDLKYRFEF
jgi:autotransporter translocation and assembly factor TamB